MLDKLDTHPEALVVPAEAGAFHVDEGLGERERRQRASYLWVTLLYPAPPQAGADHPRKSRSRAPGGRGLGKLKGSPAYQA